MLDIICRHASDERNLDQASRENLQAIRVSSLLTLACFLASLRCGSSTYLLHQQQKQQHHQQQQQQLGLLHGADAAIVYFFIADFGV